MFPVPAKIAGGGKRQILTGTNGFGLQAVNGSLGAALKSGEPLRRAPPLAKGAGRRLVVPEDEPRQTVEFIPGRG